MSWKTRNNRRYYYRSQRKGDKVYSEYIGAGPDAVLIARHDAYERERTDAKRRAWLKAKEKQDAIDREIDALGELAGDLTAAVLLVAGYHQHKYQWRKERR